MDDQEYKRSVENAHLKYRMNGATVDQPLKKQTLRVWRQNSPQMVAELSGLGVLEIAAEVAQFRMYEEMESLIAAGYPVTDAREEAERAWMMLEPEEDEAEAIPEEPWGMELD